MVKTVVATGTSSGLGFEAIKQLLQQSEPYHFILGVRDATKTQAKYDCLDFDKSKHTITVFSLDLLSLASVQSFAGNVLSQLGAQTLDYLFLCAGMLDSADGPGPNGSPWCSGCVVNHLAQHYLIHLLHDTLSTSQSRVVVVSSGAIRRVRDQNPETLDVDLKANSKAGVRTVYSASKFVQLLGALNWRRELLSCTVIAVSPGLIPSTNLATDLGLSMDMPDAKTIPEGAQNLLRAFAATDLPSDPEQIFLTSWGEWWPKDVYALALDEKLQKNGV
ncbi:short-chain dehydrogenase/reductase [Aspergillus nomiae NRRL 13137]|uniref:Short-chain dehydrogenase/reductase n=1 Tax=Aspergillus nomiae NRRL (strain ATCC 15546 / NRRL 13137 / CBS 260.88 / M93) TaxID=1509407 RepID=A0A0L1IMP6_ASPN3|nr:short-chain dehydrogenase/reductase [Aspergillus nomiae NRRL 13137]KNG80864.1 short-chain dehydrogenase/reductase [Aspergillus nomiae NRRL 13137]